VVWLGGNTNYTPEMVDLGRGVAVGLGQKKIEKKGYVV
jgi:hypothetical protein